MRGTTLVAPWCWALLAGCVVAGVELAGLWSGDGGAPPWLGAARYVAAMVTFCPIMAVLGAKRPQDRAWHIIVLALWCVLSLPAVQDVIYHYGRPVSLDSAWRWFLGILIGVGWVNYLPTRYWPSSVLCGLAQVALLADFLPVPAALPMAAPWRVATALAMFAAASALPACGWPRRRSTADTFDRLRRDFRDAYGMLWAVRIGQRAGETAQAASDVIAKTSDGETLPQRTGDTLAALEARARSSARSSLICSVLSRASGSISVLERAPFLRGRDAEDICPGAHWS